MTSASIRIQNLSVSIGGRQLIANASLTIPHGELVVLVGISGGGKSTLLRVLAGLEPQKGSDRSIEWSGEIHLEPHHPSTHIGLVFQQPALLDEWTVIQNVQLAIDHASLLKKKDAIENDKPLVEVRSDAKAWLERLQVPTGVRISRLSGGQRQRLSLAQTLASEPAVIIYDEPTTGLDLTTATEVASLIREIQSERKVTSIVVTHDYESFLPVADRVLLLDSDAKTIRELKNIDTDGLLKNIDTDGLREILFDQFHKRKLATSSQAASDSITTRSVSEGQQVTTRSVSEGQHFTTRSVSDITTRSVSEGQQLAYNVTVGAGKIVDATIGQGFALLPRWPSRTWGLRFLMHYGRLVSGGTAMIYLGVSGAIIGFVATYFSLRFMPYKVYTQPLLLEEMLGAIGFSLARILIPILTTILIASRCAAAVSADLGAKKYGGQLESMSMLRIHPRLYLQTAVLWSFLAGTLILNTLAFAAAKLASLTVFLSMYPDLGSAYWKLHFYRATYEGSSIFHNGIEWTMLKLLLSGAGISSITYHLALRAKLSTTEISRSITTTILWCTLWVLMIHLIIALFEFNGGKF